LSKVAPREGRYAKLLVAVLCYLIYVNCLGLGRAWIAQGKLAPWLGLWWVHIPTALIALYLLWASQQMRKPRKVAR
jgi:lipopolysaccharide export system permease protein